MPTFADILEYVWVEWFAVAQPLAYRHSKTWGDIVFFFLAFGVLVWFIGALAGLRFGRKIEKETIAAHFVGGLLLVITGCIFAVVTLIFQR